MEDAPTEKWLEKSTDYLLTAHVSRNLPYGDNADEVFDTFHPTLTNNVKAPVLIWIHGGYWRGLDKDHYAFSIEPIRKAGAIVVNINYTLCPNINVAGIVEQVQRACIFIYQNIDSENGDRSNIHITGHSAGGQLSAMMAAIDWTRIDPDLPVDLIKSAIPASGIFDMNNIRRTPSINAATQLDEESAIACSPILLSPAHDMPVSIVVGADETEAFILESKAMTTAWSRKLSKIRYIELPDAHHFSMIDNMVSPGDPFTRVILDHLGLDFA